MTSEVPIPKSTHPEHRSQSAGQPGARRGRATELRHDVPYDALLFVAFGGPEGPDDVMPFLDNVLRGRNVPHDRKLQVADHYHHFRGVSPINAQMYGLMTEVSTELVRRGLGGLRLYLGNRNWHPLLSDTVAAMEADGVSRALAFFTSPYSSYSGCRQYREDIERARSSVGSRAPTVDKLRVYFDHPGFIEANADMLAAALQIVPPGMAPAVLFTAHSIPLALARSCAYEQQLRETCRLVAEACGVAPASADGGPGWQLVYQSRSGAPGQPWLEPDVGDVIARLGNSGVSSVVAHPIGFISDHMEVWYDLDIEAGQAAAQAGMSFVRAPTVGIHPSFVALIGDLVMERVTASGRAGPSNGSVESADACPPGCCPPPARW